MAGTATYTSPESYVKAGKYNVGFTSIYDLDLKPSIFGQIFDAYGPGFGIFDFLNIAGRSHGVTNDYLDVFYRGAKEMPATLAEVGSTGLGIATNSAGALITFELAATDYDSDGNGPIRENQTIYIPQKYTGANLPLTYQVTSWTGTGAARVYTALPFGSASQITTAVPIGEELILGPLKYARGMDQPDGSTEGLFKRQYKTNLFKESLYIEGGQQSYARYTDTLKEVPLKGGRGTGLWGEGLALTEFKLNAGMDKSILMSEENDNALLVQTTQMSGDQKVLSGKGLWNWLDELGMKQSYVDEYDITDFDNIKDLLQSQGVTDTQVLFAVGSKLMRNIENSTTDFVKEVSGGTDFVDKMKAMKVNYKQILKNNIDVMLMELTSFSNPTSLGIPGYGFNEAGMIIPMSVASASIEGKKMQLQNLFIGERNYNGENRTRIVDTVFGMNGMGYKAQNEWDNGALYMIAEAMCVAINVNQMIQVQNQRNL